jgi:hypothetical protein
MSFDENTDVEKTTIRRVLRRRECRSLGECRATLDAAGAKLMNFAIKNRLRLIEAKINRRAGGASLGATPKPLPSPPKMTSRTHSRQLPVSSGARAHAR